jgi:hypothetical protein
LALCGYSAAGVCELPYLAAHLDEYSGSCDTIQLRGSTESSRTRGAEVALLLENNLEALSLRSTVQLIDAPIVSPKLHSELGCNSNGIYAVIELAEENSLLGESFLR